MSRAAAGEPWSVDRKLGDEIWESLFPPPSRRGAAPINKMSRYLRTRRGRGGQSSAEFCGLTSPGRAGSKVASHFLDRLGRPSSKEGKITQSSVAATLLSKED